MMFPFFLQRRWDVPTEAQQVSGALVAYRPPKFTIPLTAHEAIIAGVHCFPGALRAAFVLDDVTEVVRLLGEAEDLR